MKRYIKLFSLLLVITALTSLYHDYDQWWHLFGLLGYGAIGWITAKAYPKENQ